jgi:hypothetical protein
VSNSFFRNFQSVKAEKANYLADSSIATATATVIPTMGLLPVSAVKEF